MRYNAFFGELPINAFRPKAGGGMTLHGGGNPFESITDAISDAGSQFDDFINEEVPGGWAGVALAAAGVYYAPEIGAYLSADGAVLGATEAEAAANIGLTEGAAFTGELPAGYTGYTAPVVTDLGTVAGSTEGIASGAGNAAGGLTATPGAGTSLYDVGANIPSMGGAQGLGGGNTLAGLAEMGGAQGLTTAAAGGGLLNSAGIGGALTPAAMGLGAGLGLSNAAIGSGALSNVGSGLGAGAAGTLTGSALGDALAVGAAGNVVGGIVGAGAAKDAAQMQADAAKAAQTQQMEMFNTINAQQAPYRAAGYGALGDIGALGTGQYQMYDAQGKPTGMGEGSGYLQKQFDASDLAKGLAPNYDFMLQQGQMANQRAANMAGGGLGGNALQGLQKYTQDYAGNAYQNAFTNFQNQRSNIYNTLAGIAGIGQAGQTATNTAAANATNAATQLGVGSAAAQAAGTIGSTNAYTGAINNALNNYTLGSLLSQGGRVA
jgi:hypothetical protein